MLATICEFDCKLMQHWHPHSSGLLTAMYAGAGDLLQVTATAHQQATRVNSSMHECLVSFLTQAEQTTMSKANTTVCSQRDCACTSTSTGKGILQHLTKVNALTLSMSRGSFRQHEAVCLDNLCLEHPCSALTPMTWL